MSFVKVGDINLHYYSMGSGKPVVFVHGLGARAMTFYHQMIALRKDYRCISLDLRGFGKSTRLGNLPCSINTFVEDTRIVLKKLGLKDEKIIIGGHSLGGMIALQYALTHPDSVEKLVIIDSTSNIKHSKLSSLGMVLFPKVKPILLKERVKIIYAIKMNIYYKEAKKELVDWLIEEAKNTDESIIEAMARVTEEIRAWDVDDKISDINVPTLIFRGEKDILISKKAMDFLHKKIPNSKYVIIKKTGHCPLFEKPNLFNEVLIKFLKDEPLSNLSKNVYVVPKRNQNHA